MRRCIVALAFLFLMSAAAPLFAIQPTVVDDVIRMSRAGVSDETIIAFVHRTRGCFEVTADDIIAMTNAGLSKTLIKAVTDEAAARNEARDEARNEPAPPPAAVPYDPPVVYRPPIPDYLWDPFWYQPRLDTKSGGPAKSSALAKSGVSAKSGAPVSTGSTHRGR